MQGWEEIFFDAGAATPDTIVNAWARHPASEITKTGRKAVPFVVLSTALSLPFLVLLPMPFVDLSLTSG